MFYLLKLCKVLMVNIREKSPLSSSRERGKGKEGREAGAQGCHGISGSRSGLGREIDQGDGREEVKPNNRDKMSSFVAAEALVTLATLAHSVSHTT